MDEENQINDKLKIMKFPLLPCGLKHTQFYFCSLFIILYNKDVVGIFNRDWFYAVKWQGKAFRMLPVS